MDFQIINRGMLRHTQRLMGPPPTFFLSFSDPSTKSHKLILSLIFTSCRLCQVVSVNISLLAQPFRLFGLPPVLDPGLDALPPVIRTGLIGPGLILLLTAALPP